MYIRELDRPVSVKVIPRPPKRRARSFNLSFLGPLAVLSLFIGAFAAAATGSLPLPSFSEPNATAFDAANSQTTQQPEITLPTVAPTNARLQDSQESALPSTALAADSRPQTASASASSTLPQYTLLQGLRHEYQWWNNCAPSTLGMVLSYYDRTEAQAEIAPILKPDPNDKNVSPPELAAFAETIGFHAHVGVGGDVDLLKRLLAAGFPVIVEFWLELESDDGMGHYRVLFGYDDRSQTFLAHDSYVGPNVTASYAGLDSAWQVFNRTYVVVYPETSRETVDSILTASNRGQEMWLRAFQTAQEELAQNENNAFAWFNLGTSALQLGDTQQAAQAFDWARRVGLPSRMLWYQFGPFEAYLAQGRYQDVITLAGANLENAAVEEWHYWRGRAREMTGDLAGARSDYSTAIELNANFAAAREALEQSQAA